MKLIVLYFVAYATIILAESNVRNPAENERYARIIFENARKNIPCGFPDIGETGIPPVDPLLIESFEVRQRETGVDVISTMTNTYMRGLQYFINQKFTFNPDQTVEYIFTTDYMTMDGDHWTRGTMVGIPVVNGNGRMYSEMFNSRYHGFVKWSTQPDTGYIYPVSHTVTVDIQHMTMQMTGFGALNNTINQRINDSIPDMIASADFQQQMNDMLSRIIMPLFTAMSYRQTVDTITDHLAYLANNPEPKRC